MKINKKLLLYIMIYPRHGFKSRGDTNRVKGNFKLIKINKIIVMNKYHIGSFHINLTIGFVAIVEFIW